MLRKLYVNKIYVKKTLCQEISMLRNKFVNTIYVKKILC